MRGREQVIRSLWRDLLPTAFLLTGDQATAQHLVVRALASGRAAAVADHDAAVSALVRTHRRRWPTSGTGRITGELPVPWWAAPADVAAAHDLAAHLDTLDRDHRTAAVLHWHEQWDTTRVAALLPHVDLAALARRLPPDLPRRLETLAGLADTSALDDDTVARAVRATAARRARHAVVGVLGVAAIVAAGVWWPAQAPAPAATPPDRDRPAVTSAEPQGVLAAAPRGPLVTDDVMDGVRTRLAAQGTSTDGLRPLYGDDVEGVRVLLVAGPDGEQYWLTGPAGAPPTVLDVSGVGLGPEDATAMAVTVSGPDGRVRLVVVTEEGTGLVVKPGVDVDPGTGTASSEWLDLPTTDGIAAVTLDRTWSSGIRLLADAPDEAPVLIWTASADTTYWVQDTGPGPVSRSGAATASAYAYTAALTTISDATGRAPADLQVSVLGAVDVPTPSGDTVEVVGLAAVLPGGAVVTSTGSGYLQVTETSGASSWNDCGASSYPAGTDPADLVVAATCLVSGPDDAGFGRLTVVFAPPGTGVELQTVDGTPVPVDLVAGAGWSTYVGPQDLATATADGVTYPVAGSGANALAY